MVYRRILGFSSVQSLWSCLRGNQSSPQSNLLKVTLNVTLGLGLWLQWEKTGLPISLWIFPTEQFLPSIFTYLFLGFFYYTIKQIQKAHKSNVYLNKVLLREHPLGQRLEHQRVIWAENKGCNQETHVSLLFSFRLTPKQNESTRRHKTEFIVERCYFLCRKWFYSFLGKHKFCKLKNTHSGKKEKIFFYSLFLSTILRSQD